MRPPIPPSSRAVRAFLAVLCAALAGCGTPAKSGGPVGLFTTLPILWAESADVAGLLADDAPPHWARAELERGGAVVPLDTLAGTGAGARPPLGGLSLLVMAQPRPLSPDENVALDAWVRGGGRVLLFADPLLTAESAYPLGDKRRPQDVVLLSPILGRWGLALAFDEDRLPGEAEADAFGVALPVNLPGQLSLTGNRGNCTLAARGIAARCRIGRGSVVVVADAALFEAVDSGDSLRRDALRALVDMARD